MKDRNIFFNGKFSVMNREQHLELNQKKKN